MLYAKTKLIGHNAVLNEIITGQWLMSFNGLLQLGHFMQELGKGKAEERCEEDRGTNLLSFFNEDYERINPRDTSEIPAGSVAVVHAIGPMMKYGSYYMLGANEIIAQLDFVNNLQNVSAIVLYVDGPGGSVAAIPPFLDFAKRKRKPIVALCDASMSLHRWIPDAVSDYQLADNDICARFGSVGVVSSWMDAKKYYEEMGIKIHEVYPEESAHKNEIWRLMQDNEEKGKEMLRKMHLSPMAIKFQEAVKAAHPNLIEEEGVLTGRTFTTDDAIRIRMINGKGNMMEAMQTAKALAEAYQYSN